MYHAAKHLIGYLKTYGRLIRSKNKRKIIYTMAAPKRLTNLGDHAQDIAITRWFKKNFPALKVMEFNSVETKKYICLIKRYTHSDDLVFLRSGGNLGDRYLDGEILRRQVIQSFVRNKTVILPQTIYFSDTPSGAREQELTSKAYAAHPDLTVIARDPRSGELAKTLFPFAQTFCMPDFALSLKAKPHDSKSDAQTILLCLRKDEEGILSAHQKQQLAASLPYRYKYSDTVLDRPIPKNKRESILDKNLRLFQSSAGVVTDRFHGLIFSVICGRPCVVLPSSDHKLSSGISWFKEIPFVTFAKDIEEVPALLEHCLSAERSAMPDWNEIYFDRIPKLLGYDERKPCEVTAVEA